jgi:hypothetical protein
MQRGRAFGTRFFTCPAEQLKIAQTKPQSLTRHAPQNAALRIAAEILFYEARIKKIVA